MVVAQLFSLGVIATRLYFMPTKQTKSKITLESLFAKIEELQVINEELHVLTESKLDAIQSALGQPGFDWLAANLKALEAAEVRLDVKKREFSRLQAKRKKKA